MAIRLKLIVSEKAYPKHLDGTNPVTGKSYDFVSGWGKHTDETGVTRWHRITMKSIVWNSLAAEGLRERDDIYVETLNEGEPSVDGNGQQRTNKASDETEYTVMEYPVEPVDYAPRAKFRGLPLPLAKDLPSGNRRDKATVANTVADDGVAAP